MPIIRIEDISSVLEEGKILAGIDLGKKTIGLALSDCCFSFAHPRPAIKRKKFTIDSQKLIKFFTDNHVGVAIIGLPVHMNSQEGSSAQSVRTFVAHMGKISTIPFILQDERLSTVAAHKTLQEMNFSIKQQSQKIDSTAAAFILQGVLDSLRLRIS